jgi:hypothetical protein
MLLDFIIRIYHNALSSECQTNSKILHYETKQLGPFRRPTKDSHKCARGHSASDTERCGDEMTGGPTAQVTCTYPHMLICDTNGRALNREFAVRIYKL